MHLCPQLGYGQLPFYPIPSCSQRKKDSFAFQYQYLKWFLGIGHFEVARQVQVIGILSALWSVLGQYGFIHWLWRGCPRNWVKIFLPKQSHSAIRRSTDPVSGASSNWPPARVTFHIYLHEVKWQPWEKRPNVPISLTHVSFPKSPVREKQELGWVGWNPKTVNNCLFFHPAVSLLRSTYYVVELFLCCLRWRWPWLKMLIKLVSGK